MLFTYLAPACLWAICCSALLHERQSSMESLTIFAYGQETDGYPVIYADGLAYIGRTAPAFATLSTNITFTTDATSTTDPWTITANSSTVTFNETIFTYLIPTAGSLAQVGFASSEDSLPENAVTAGFSWFGTSVAFAASESSYELKFWANMTSEMGIYGLYWNSGDVMDGSFPVTLKSTPPTIL